MTSAVPAAVPRSADIVDLDVREDLRNGREPFSKIMAAIDALPEESVLHLRATFEPVPLFRVLGKKGFSHEARQNEPEDWSVWFWKHEQSDHSAEARQPAATPQPRNTGAEPQQSSTVVLDVRGLEPPEPMIRTLTALETLPAEQELLQINERVPQFLLPILAERGYGYEVDESRAGEVRVRIRRLS